MSLVLSLLAALGVLLLYQGLTEGRRRPSSRASSRLRLLLDEAGMTRVSSTRVVAASAVCFLVVAFAVTGIASSVPVGVLFGLGASWAPFALARSRRVKRRKRFREAWPDAIATLISGVRAGMSLPEACGSIGERGPVDLRPAFASFRSTYRSTGSFITSLDRLRAELSDPTADRIFVALKLAHEVGGTDLVRVLRTLGNFVREDLRLRKEIEARWSWTVSAARVAAAAPWIVLLLMSTQPEAARAYNSSTGLTTMMVGATCTLVGYRLMLKAAQLPEQQRLGR